MKLVHFSLPNEEEVVRFGVVTLPDKVVDLEPLFASFPAERQPKELSIQGGLTALVPPALIYGILKTLEVPSDNYSIEGIKLHSPVYPSSLRDFYAFEQHVKTSNANRGRDVPEEWYEFPVFYFSNASAVYGPDDVIPYPSYSDALDYELEITCVIGREGRNIKAEQAKDYIFGYMIFNDWSARDVQRQEMKVGLGPAKGKDFASSFGPFLVTPDELQDRHTGRPGVYDLAMVARVNGVERSRGNMKDLYWSFGQMIERASQDVTLYPGEVIGSGTVGTGCLLELTKGQGPWLQPGDVVELEVERLGVLRNIIGEKRNN